MTYTLVIERTHFSHKTQTSLFAVLSRPFRVMIAK